MLCASDLVVSVCKGFWQGVPDQAGHQGWSLQIRGKVLDSVRKFKETSYPQVPHKDLVAFSEFSVEAMLTDSRLQHKSAFGRRARCWVLEEILRQKIVLEWMASALEHPDAQDPAHSLFPSEFMGECDGPACGLGPRGAS